MGAPCRPSQHATSFSGSRRWPFGLRVSARALWLFQPGSNNTPQSPGLPASPNLPRCVFGSALALTALLRHPDPGLPSHPTLATAQRYLPRGFGGIVTFGLKPSPAGLPVIEQVGKFMHALKLCYYAANLGDTRTLVVQPWTTTQSQLSERSKAENGTRIEAIRVSLGLEDVEDVKKGECGGGPVGRDREELTVVFRRTVRGADFDQAIAVAMAATPAVVV